MVGGGCGHCGGGLGVQRWQHRVPGQPIVEYDTEKAANDAKKAAGNAGKVLRITRPTR